MIAACLQIYASKALSLSLCSRETSDLGIHCFNITLFITNSMPIIAIDYKLAAGFACFKVPLSTVLIISSDSSEAVLGINCGQVLVCL